MLINEQFEAVERCNSKKIIILAGRQVGKSSFIVKDIVKQEGNSLLISPTLRLSQELERKCCALIPNLIYKRFEDVIYKENGGFIFFESVLNPEILCQNSFSSLYIDEADSVDKKTFSLLKNFIENPEKRIVLVSSLSRKNNTEFLKIWKSDDRSWHKFHIIDRYAEFYYQEMKYMPEEIFRQEYLAEVL